MARTALQTNAAANAPPPSGAISFWQRQRLSSRGCEPQKRPVHRRSGGWTAGPAQQGLLREKAALPSDGNAAAVALLRGYCVAILRLRSVRPSDHGRWCVSRPSEAAPAGAQMSIRTLTAPTAQSSVALLSALWAGLSGGQSRPYPHRRSLPVSAVDAPGGAATEVRLMSCADGDTAIVSLGRPVHCTRLPGVAMKRVSHIGKVGADRLRHAECWRRARSPQTMAIGPS